MTTIRTYGMAVRVLKSVANGGASRSWVRVIQYAITSPTRIADLKWTAAERAHLQEMINNLKGKRIKRSPSPKKKKSPKKIH